jgi:hypothetical protein
MHVSPGKLPSMWEDTLDHAQQPKKLVAPSSNWGGENLSIEQAS